MNTVDCLKGFFAVIAASALLAACGGDGASPTGDARNAGGPGAGAPDCDPADPDTYAGCGTGYVTVTDAEGDILSYTVDLVSLSLRRANGSEVETLPASARIDLANYTELSEFVTAAQIPPGTYVEGSITVDYSEAEIFVERDGEAIQAAVLDSEGAPLGRYTLDVQLTDRGQLVVTAGRPALLAIDFDLAASNEVDTGAEPPTLTVQPVLLAEIDPVDEKELRVRGRLEDVDVEAGTYDVDVLPLLRDTGSFGRLTVSVSEQTSFDIDGEIVTGSEGLEALAALPEDTLTVAFGVLSRDDLGYTADTVLAGSSVPGIEADAVTGTVVGRDGDSILVRGAAVVRSGEKASAFFDTVTATLSDATTVSRPGDPVEGLTADAVSVGQRVRVLGTLEDAEDAGEPADEAGAQRRELVIDARSGRVQLLRSRLSGIVTDARSGALTLDVATINGRGTDLYDFAGTGPDPELDADPQAYEIDTGVLDTGAPVGAAARVFGYVSAFGTAPPDFEAVTTVEYESLRAVLRLFFGRDGATDAILSAGGEGVAVNVDALLRGVIRLPGLRAPIMAPISLPLLTGSAERSRFAIVVDDEVQMYEDFAAFTTDLALRLDGTTAVVSVTAAGSWTPVDTSLEARSIVVVLSSRTG